MSGRGARGDRRLARGLQLAPAALRARDEGAGRVRRRVGRDERAADGRLSCPGANQRDRPGVPRRARRVHRRYASRLRRSAPRRRSRIPTPAPFFSPRSDRPGRYLPPATHIHHQLSLVVDRETGSGHVSHQATAQNR